jgi:hypothetical protein
MMPEPPPFKTFLNACGKGASSDARSDAPRQSTILPLTSVAFRALEEHLMTEEKREEI